MRKPRLSFLDLAGHDIRSYSYGECDVSHQIAKRGFGGGARNGEHMRWRGLTKLGVGLFAGALLMGGVAPAIAAAEQTVPAHQLPELLQVADAVTSPKYERDRFQEKIDADGDGCNTRQEVLIRDSLTAVNVGSGCKLSGGTWSSAYDAHTTNDASTVEMDRVVALAEAWRSGAWAWSDTERRDFANDLGVDYALVLASSSSNQKKADRDPSSWVPASSDLVCDYVQQWALIKYRWGLAVDSAEKTAIAGYLSGECGSQQVTLPALARVATAPPETPSTPDTATPDTQTSEPTSSPQTVIASFAKGETRLAGSDRYQTAIAASKKFSPGVPSIFVATGRDFPDALSASAAAAQLGAPLLLTDRTSVPQAIFTEIKRLKPAKIYMSWAAPG